MKYRITLNLSAVGHLMKVYAKHEYVEEETSNISKRFIWQS